MNKKEFNQKISEISNAFATAQKRIGAQDVIFKLIPRELRDTLGKFNAGKPITGAELQKISENWQSKAPLIDEEGNAFVLYIPDWQYNFEREKGTPEGLHKYHVSWCKTLEYMQGAGRFKRYIKKTDIENNIFTGKKTDDAEVKSVLHACKNCREKMSETWGQSLYFDVASMDMLKFFSLYGKQDLHDPKTNRPYSVIYPKHWAVISKMYREKAGWRCEECNKSFINQKHLLDVHHVNGIRSDVSKANLRVLCKEHHAEQPFHTHYKNILQATPKTSELDLPNKPSNTPSSVTSSQRNKFDSFIANPDRYATGSEKTKLKVREAQETFNLIKGSLSEAEQNKFYNALKTYQTILNK